MRFSSLLFLGLTSVVSALPVAEPGSEVSKRLFFPPIISNTVVVDTAIQVIKQGTQRLDAAIKKVNSDDLLVLLSVDDIAQELSATIVQQTKKVSNSPPIGLFNALGVAIKAQDLINTVKQTLQDLKSKKKFVVQASVTDLVIADLKKLKGNADDFVSALKVKVPSIAQFLADLDKNQIDKAFDDAIAFFSS